MQHYEDHPDHNNDDRKWLISFVGCQLRVGLILFRAVPGLIAIGCILICSHTSTAKFSGKKETYFFSRQIYSLLKVNHTLSLCLFNDVAIQSQAQAPEARNETSVYCLEYFYPALFL